jgi:GH24 family phage-related lysozyme (muramidase)
MKIPAGLIASIGSKVLGKGAKSIASKVSGGGDSNNTSAMFKVIAKNFIALPGIARDLNVAKQNIMKLVELEGGKASNDAPDSPMGSKVLSGEEAKAKLEKELEKGKQKTPTPVLPKKAGGGGLLGTIGKLFKVGAVIFALSQIPGGFIKDMFDGIVDSIKELAGMLLEEIKTAFDGFVADIKKFFNDVVKPIMNELTAFLQNVWQKITDFFKPIFNWVGDKIKIIVDYLRPIFDFMKGVLDKVFAVINALKEKLAVLQPYYDSLMKKVELAQETVKKAEEAASAAYDKAKSFLGFGDKKESPKTAAATSTAAKPLPSTGAGAGRGGQGGSSAAEAIKKNLSPSQLQWLGNADPTDEYIMARMPAPIAGEKGGPPAPKPAAAAAGAGAPSGPAPVVSAGKAPAMGSLDDTKKMIIKHEGIKDMPYKDSLGLWTVGVGHLIGDGKSLPPEYNRKFTQAEIMKMFDDDFAHHAKAAEKIPGYSKANQGGQGALIDLTFNMGNSWYKKWPTFCKKLSEGDFKGAADELASSKWAQQVKSRAQTIIGLVTGAGEGGAAPTPVGGGTQVASASPTAAPSPAPAPTSGASVGGPAKISAPAPMSGSVPSASGAAPTAVGGSLSSLVKTEPGVDLSQFSSEFEKRVAIMAADFKLKTGKALLITSGYRSNEKQKTLWDAMMEKVGGDKAKARKLVAEPMAPLGQGKGSLHLKGLAIDINSKGAGGINALAGPRDKPTGWLESFGLTRPVANEDWHVQGTGLPPTPDNPANPGSPTLVAGKDGKPTNLATGKSESLPVEATSSGSGSGAAVASASTEIAAGQREQQKPTTPIIVNAPTTTTTTVVKNESVRSPNEKIEDSNQTLLERVA